MILKIAIKLRIHPIKRRSPMQRLHAKLYYRRNKAKIRLQRRRYTRSHHIQLKHRKQFKRFRPSWLQKPKQISKPKKPAAPHKFKVFIPRKIK